MTEREMAIVSAYTGVLLGRFCEMHKYIEQIMKRPVFTHEMGSKKIMEEIKCRSKRDFCSLAEPQHGCEPEKVKLLAQYLDEYIEHEVELNNICAATALLYAYNSWRELLEQALDAYEINEEVRIRIERV